MDSKRRITEREAERVSRNLLANTDEFFQFAQLKATLRLLRDDETVDKGLLTYADQAVSTQFNKLLRDAVPGLEKAERSVGEMLSITDDPLLSSLRDHRYVVKYNDVSMPFEDLRYWPMDAGFALSVSDNRSTTFLSKEDGDVYMVKCPKCDDQSIRLVKREGELVAISCSNCKKRLVNVDPTPTLEPKPSKRANLHEVRSGPEAIEDEEA
jgi:hypothetical protein